MSKGLITAVSLTTAAAVLEPLRAVPAGSILLLIGLIAAGGLMLWRLQRRLEVPDANGNLTARQRRQLEDDCELATFAALQEAGEFLATAGELLAEGPDNHVLSDRYDECLQDIEDFVFTGNGLGDLAAAWAIEDTTHSLATDAAKLRRPAA